MVDEQLLQHLQRQQQQEKQQLQQQQQHALSFNNTLREISKTMRGAAVLTNYGAIEGKNFIEPNTTTDEGVQHSKARKRKAIDDVHKQVNKK